MLRATKLDPRSFPQLPDTHLTGRLRTLGGASRRRPGSCVFPQELIFFKGAFGPAGNYSIEVKDAGEGGEPVRVGFAVRHWESNSLDLNVLCSLQVTCILFPKLRHYIRRPERNCLSKQALGAQTSFLSAAHAPGFCNNRKLENCRTRLHSKASGKESWKAIPPLWFVTV